MYYLAEKFLSLIVALVLSRLDYCKNFLFELPANLIQRIQSVQNAERRSEHILPHSLAFTGCASQSASPSN